MAKNNLISLVLAVVAVLSGIAIGGLFLDGTTLANPILGIIPQTIHSIVGWVIMIGGILEALKLMGIKLL